ncbi:MAG TPA: shikimate kinase, partial [Pirellulaceae bacterium]
MLVSLVGYRGSGKSAVGRELANRLGWSWIDVDQELESRTGCSIAELFGQLTEPGFRDLEENLVAELVDRAQTVLSLGGGAVLREPTRKRIRDAGLVVWLRARPATLLARIAADPRSVTSRPPLTRLDPAAEI